MIIPAAQAMLRTAELPKSYWDYATGADVYLHNKSPHSGVGGIPLQLLTGTPVKLSHLVTFGCPAYVHIPSHQRRKLEDKAFEGIMVGYSTDSPGYIIYNKQTRRTVVTKHVRFDETFKGRLLDKTGEALLTPGADPEPDAPGEGDNSSDSDDSAGDTGVEPGAVGTKLHEDTDQRESAADQHNSEIASQEGQVTSGVSGQRRCEEGKVDVCKTQWYGT